MSQPPPVETTMEAQVSDQEVSTAPSAAEDISVSDASQQLPGVSTSEESEEAELTHKGSMSANEESQLKKKKRRSMCPANTHHDKEHAQRYYERMAEQTAFAAKYFGSWQDWNRAEAV